MSVPTVSVSLTSVLKDSAGNPLSGAVVNFSAKDINTGTTTPVGSATTDSTGTVTLTPVSGILESDQYEFIASFGGISGYTASSASAAFDASQVLDATSISATISPPTPLPGQIETITGKLTDTTKNVVIPNATIGITIDGNASGVVITDSTGIFSASVGPFTGGNHKVILTYAGDSLTTFYSTQTFTINFPRTLTAGATSLLAVAVAGVVAATAIGIVVMRRKKRR